VNRRVLDFQQREPAGFVRAGDVHGLVPLPMSDTRRRKGISRAEVPPLALDMRLRVSPAGLRLGRGASVACQGLAAVQHILAQRVEFWPLSDRSIHYALLNDPPLRHAAKPDSVYANDRASYHDLTDLLTRARPNGWVCGAR
jgi:hypothetical protein